MRKVDLSDEKDQKKLTELLIKAYQSANINFLLGAGTSSSAIKTLGNVEKVLTDLDTNKLENVAEYVLFKFLKDIFNVHKTLLEKPKELSNTLLNYEKFISSLNKILLNRKNDITIPLANIFTTNYDLFIEHSFEKMGDYFHYNDGFTNKNKMFEIPVLDVAEFNKIVSCLVPLYGYDTILPNINLLKLHGSVNWEIMQTSSETNLVFSKIEKIIEEFNSIDISKWDKKIEEIIATSNIIKIKKDEYPNISDISKMLNKIGIINPTKKKFKETVMNRTYYNFMRFFANTLEKTNSLICAIGFSFNDEHIKDIVLKALRFNPTLKLIVFIYSENELEQFTTIFKEYKNITLVFDTNKELSFERFSNYFEVTTTGLLDDEKEN